MEKLKMGEQKINLGIIGMGRMGITHYSIINSNPFITIKAVADNSKVILNVLQKYLKGLKTFNDYHELLKFNELDAILVCTPPNIHYDIVSRAADFKLHVFVEKPFTANLEQAGNLNTLYQDLGLVNQVGYVNRYNDVFLKVKEYISSGVIGRIIRFKSEMFSCTITRPDDGSGWRASRENGGGAVYEMASHAIDLVNYIVGKPIKVVGSSLNKIFSRNVEDAVSSTFLYNNDMSGTIYINWSDESYRKPTNKIEIFGELGKIVADQHSLKTYLKSNNSKYNLRQGWNTQYITDLFQPVNFYVRGNEFTRQLNHFVDCINDSNLKNLCSFRDGYDTLEIINKIFIDFDKNGNI